MPYSRWLGKSTVCREEESVLVSGSPISDSEPYAICSYPRARTNDVSRTRKDMIDDETD